MLTKLLDHIARYFERRTRRQWREQAADALYRRRQANRPWGS